MTIREEEKQRIRELAGICGGRLAEISRRMTAEGYYPITVKTIKKYLDIYKIQASKEGCGKRAISNEGERTARPSEKDRYQERFRNNTTAGMIPSKVGQRVKTRSVYDLCQSPDAI